MEAPGIGCSSGVGPSDFLGDVDRKPGRMAGRMANLASLVLAGRRMGHPFGPKCFETLVLCRCSIARVQGFGTFSSHRDDVGTMTCLCQTVHPRALCSFANRLKGFLWIGGCQRQTWGTWSLRALYKALFSFHVGLIERC